MKKKKPSAKLIKNKTQAKNQSPQKPESAPKSETKSEIGKAKLKKPKKTAVGESTLLKKDFRENPAVEQLYKIIYKYKLRKEAYKVAIEIYLNLKK